MLYGSFHRFFFVQGCIAILIPVLQIGVSTKYPVTILKRSIKRKRTHGAPITIHIDRRCSSYTGFTIVCHLVGYIVNGILEQSGSYHISLMFGIIRIEIQRKSIRICRLQRRVTDTNIQRVGTVGHRLEIAYIRLFPFSPIHNLQTGAF